MVLTVNDLGKNHYSAGTSETSKYKNYTPNQTCVRIVIIIIIYILEPQKK